MFYFQQLLQQGLNGIDGTAMLPAIIGIGYTILLVGFIVGLYQAAMRGGDVQALAVSAIKYLVIAIILANWSTVFREVNDSFGQVAQFIGSSSGAGDMFLSWMDQLKQQFSNNGISSLLPAISATFAAIITALMILASYVTYAMMVVVFGFFYVLYGCVLYVLGPLVLALLPMAGVGQLAKGYATNLMIWNAWGILYATFGSLITALHFNRIEQVMNQGFLSGFFQGSSDSTVLGLVSVFYALALGLIPFVARRLISGDIGSSAFSMVRAGAAAAGAVIAGVNGFAAGASAAESAPALAAGAGVSAPAISSTALASSSSPPPQPTMAETIRSGIMSALGAGGAPPAPSANANHDERLEAAGAAAASGATGTATRAPGTAKSFRPGGATETIAFHAARFAASSLSGNARRNDQGST